VKIKTMELPYEQVCKLTPAPHKEPMRPSFLLASLVRLLGARDLKETNFTYSMEGMEQVEGVPCLILMNHSSFIDLEIASRIFYPKPYGIVCTSDGFIGKEWLMRRLGCIPTRKFVTDVNLIRDMEYLLKKKNVSVLMYPEASYSFDGTATALPRKLGVLLKKLGVPVVMVRTQGAFARDPLFNCLQKRRVRVSAAVKRLLTAQQIRELSVKEIDAMLDGAFDFDGFAWQAENDVRITEPFRADGLNRILYKCASCHTEGEMEGRGTELFCRHCGKRWELTELGRLRALTGETIFDHIPDWYRWERQQIRRELEDGSYGMDIEVDIGMMVDYKAIYMVGSGRLRHDESGFTLTGCDGKLNYTQSPLSCYGLYADYYWYEMGDVICIGNQEALYYCFPKGGAAVAKARMAVEELYKLRKGDRRTETAAL